MCEKNEDEIRDEAIEDVAEVLGEAMVCPPGVDNGCPYADVAEVTCANCWEDWLYEALADKKDEGDDDQDALDLEPCPLCEGVAELFGDEEGTFSIRCTDCDLKTRSVQGRHTVAIIDEWNNRAS